MPKNFAFFVALLTLTPAAHAGPIFQETFEELADGDLNGQGGWSGGTMFLSTPGTHLPTRVLNGFIAGTGFPVERHAVTLPTLGNPAITMSFNAYAQSGVSHNSGVGFQVLGQSGSVTPGGMSWLIDKFTGGWDFDARDITGNSSAIFSTHGGYDTPVSLNIVLDQRNNAVYGQWNFGAGGSGETTHFAVAAGSIAALDGVTAYMDFRPTSGGIEVDNILANAVPEPSGFGLVVAGVWPTIACVRRLARRRP